MELVLGTVQFGLRYGVAGRRAPVPEDEVRAILACAWEHGVRLLDTAAAYGDIEPRLVGLAEGRPFRVVTKLPALPAPLAEKDAAQWARANLEQSRARLGGHLHAVLFHRAEDLLEQHAQALWTGCADWAGRHDALLGASAYGPHTLTALRHQFPLSVGQLPGNALDQRMSASPWAADMQIHVRSAFLQGLLLMDPHLAASRVPAAAPALARWHAWTQARGLTPLRAALGVVKGLPGATHCVVGVDGLAQFEAIATAWHDAAPLAAQELAIDELDAIDPRRWPSSQPS